MNTSSRYRILFPKIGDKKNEHVSHWIFSMNGQDYRCSIKSNAPDIVNWLDLHKVCLSIVSEEYWYFSNHETPLRKLKTGDIFDLPSGYEFKKEFHDPCIEAKDCLKPDNGWKCMSVCKIGSEPVLRIVKTEVYTNPDESPEDRRLGQLIADRLQKRRDNV